MRLIILTLFFMSNAVAWADSSVWVGKPDGSLSCEKGSGQSLKEAAKELKKASIRVLQSRKGTDGKMHVQMCGAETGVLNEFRISKENLNKARELGYTEVSMFKKE